MWQVLLAAAVAGSTGFATKHFLTPRNPDPLPAPPRCSHNNQPPPAPAVENANNLEDPIANCSYESGFESNSETQNGNAIFTFSSSESLRQAGAGAGATRSRPNKSRGSKNGVRFEQRSGAEKKKKGAGRKLPFCLKKRKTVKNIMAAKSPFCSSKDNSSFGWGLGFGIMYMMSAGRAEINKLNKTMDKTAKAVQELKSELNRRKSSCVHQILDSDGNIDMNSHEMGGKHYEAMLKKTNSELRGTDVKIWSPAVNDGGECGSSTLTEEPEPRVLEMDQLEAELEFELQKLSGCTIDSPCHEEIRPHLDELEVPDEGCNGTDDSNFNYSQFHGVLASELNQKLSHLLIKQQENQIEELESELHLAQSNLRQKEAELQALKDCVRHLTELSISTVSDDETQALTDPKETSDLDNNYMESESKETSDLDNNNMESESKLSVVGAKRPFGSESYSYCM